MFIYVCVYIYTNGGFWGKQVDGSGIGKEDGWLKVSLMKVVGSGLKRVVREGDDEGGRSWW